MKADLRRRGHPPWAGGGNAYNSIYDWYRLGHPVWKWFIYSHPVLPERRSDTECLLRACNQPMTRRYAAAVHQCYHFDDLPRGDVLDEATLMNVTLPDWKLVSSVAGVVAVLRKEIRQ